MNFSLLWLPLTFGLLDWIAVSARWKLLEYFAKPGTMIAILIWMWVARPAGSGFGMWGWFVAGIFLSMLGDVFLMLPREQFIAGLVSFLLAHVTYIVGLSSGAFPLNVATLFLAASVGLVAVRLYHRIAARLAASGQAALQKPVLAYAIVIGVMLFSALLTLVRAEWAAGPALLVSAGAFLFFLSDTMLAWNRFVEPLTHGKLKVIVTYHLGQLALVAGAGLQLL